MGTCGMRKTLDRPASNLLPLFKRAALLLLIYVLGSQIRLQRVVQPRQSFKTIDIDKLFSPFQLDSPNLFKRSHPLNHLIPVHLCGLNFLGLQISLHMSFQLCLFICLKPSFPMVFCLASPSSPLRCSSKAPYPLPFHSSSNQRPMLRTALTHRAPRAPCKQSTILRLAMWNHLYIKLFPD